MEASVQTSLTSLILKVTIPSHIIFFLCNKYFMGLWFLSWLIDWFFYRVLGDGIIFQPGRDRIHEEKNGWFAWTIWPFYYFYNLFHQNPCKIDWRLPKFWFLLAGLFWFCDWFFGFRLFSDMQVITTSSKVLRRFHSSLKVWTMDVDFWSILLIH